MRIVRFKMAYLDEIKESKIPMHEKIPKDSLYYKHWLKTSFTDEMKRSADETAKYDRDMMTSVVEEMNYRSSVIKIKEEIKQRLREGVKDPFSPEKLKPEKLESPQLKGYKR